MFDKPLNRWWTVVAGVLGNAVGAGAVSGYVLGIFTKSISADFGWDRSFTTLGLTCFFFVAGVGSLCLGTLMTRWPLRAVAIVFVALFSASIMAVAALPPSVILFVILFSLMGLFSSAATPMPYAIVLSRQFDRNRGIVLALMASGAGLGALVLPGYANFLLENYGWRAGYFGVGLVAGVVGLAGLVFFLRIPLQEPVHAASKGLSLKDIFSGGTFWLIALSILAISIALMGLLTNLVPILTDRGMSSANAALMISLLGAASWISRISVGLLIDRVHVKFVAAGIFLISAAGIATIALSPLGLGIYIGAVLIGIGMGAESDLVTFTMSRYFKSVSLARALGGVWIFWAWGNGIGISTGSLSYDLTGSYDAAFIFFGTLALLGCGLILQLGPYVVPVHEE